MPCKGCGSNTKLIKAHIIPESFFTGLRDGEKAPKVISNTPGVYPKKAPIGIYDKNILCRNCEDRFQLLDDYGYRVLIVQEQNHQSLVDVRSGRTIGYKINQIDHSTLKLFFISILWRASISEHIFYSKINLGELEVLAKESIWKMDAGNSHYFSFVLGKFDGDASSTGRTILDPHAEKWFGVNYYRFYLYGFILYIKADEQETPAEWSKFISGGNDLIVVSRGNIEGSKEYPILQKTVRTQKT